jgi:hypothetical protein
VTALPALSRAGPAARPLQPAARTTIRRVTDPRLQGAKRSVPWWHGGVVAIALWLFLPHLVLLVDWLLTQALDERLSRSANSGGR